MALGHALKGDHVEVVEVETPGGRIHVGLLCNPLHSLTHSSLCIGL